MSEPDYILYIWKPLKIPDDVWFKNETSTGKKRKPGEALKEQVDTPLHTTDLRQIPLTGKCRYTLTTTLDHTAKSYDGYFIAVSTLCTVCRAYILFLKQKTLAP